MRISNISNYVRSYMSSGVSYMILYVTSRCNQKCDFCFYADSLNAQWGDGLTLDEITKVSKSVNPCVQWTLTGGETFLRKDLVDIVRVLVGYAGGRNLTFPTNGYMTDRIVSDMEKLCKEFPSMDFRIGLSIDALEETHDAIRGIRGAFRKAEQTFHEIKKMQRRFSNLHLALNTVASKYNKNDLKQFIDYAVENLWCDDHSLVLVRGKANKEDAKEINAQEYHHLVAYLEKRKTEKSQAKTFHKRLLKFIETETRAIVDKTYKEKAFQIPCVAGQKLAVLYDSGDLYPCEIIDMQDWPEKTKKNFGGNFRIGNIRDYDFDIDAMLNSERGKAIYNLIINSKCFCTFECSNAASIVFNPKTLVKTIISPPSAKVL